MQDAGHIMQIACSMQCIDIDIEILNLMMGSPDEQNEMRF